MTLLSDDIQYQAEAFLDWSRRRGRSESSFNAWARTKDFGPADRRAIWAAVERLRYA